MREHTIKCPHCKNPVDVCFHKEHDDFVFVNCYHCKASLSVERKTELRVLLLGKPGLKEQNDESNM